MNNYQKSWVGQPTTNLVGDGMSIYNNVPGDVTATLATTGEYYRGAPIYKLTLTPTTASGVSYLTAGNNPGIGVVGGGGGGLANRYTGHSIFFRPTVPMHSSPIYTNYSNIGGWQSGTNYYSMNDGWLRAHVIWYDTVTRSDGKYWAINPAGATLNVPIVIYWAGPFKEDRNDSVFVSPYTTGTRNNTNNLIDLTGQNTITASSLTYNSDGTFSWASGVDARIQAPSSSIFSFGTGDFTLECWIKPDNFNNYVHMIALPDQNTFALKANTGDGLIYFYSPSFTTYPTSGWTLVAGAWNHVVMTRANSSSFSYLNGSLKGSKAGFTNNFTAQTLNIGNGYPNEYTAKSIGAVKIYNRALTSQEILQNFNAQRGLYGI